jgi:hypothetical protein
MGLVLMAHAPAIWAGTVPIVRFPTLAQATAVDMVCVPSAIVRAIQSGLELIAVIHLIAQGMCLNLA